MQSRAQRLACTSSLSTRATTFREIASHGGQNSREKKTGGSATCDKTLDTRQYGWIFNLNDDVRLRDIDRRVPDLRQTDAVDKRIHPERTQDTRTFALRRGTVDIRDSQDGGILEAEGGGDVPVIRKQNWARILCQARRDKGKTSKPNFRGKTYRCKS